MTTQRNPLRWAFGLLAVACAAMTLVAPTARADPQGDALGAIDLAWTAAGGDTSPLGPKAGDIYPAGAGFGQNFANGAMFFSPDTGARSMFGAILEKYRAAGGPEGDLGFPNMDEGPGRVSPESRNVTFNAPGTAVIFWTPQTGAWVVRGILNSAWDRLGGSAGPLGVPVEDEIYSGETISQRFAGGQLTYDTAARTFISTPPELAGQLADLALPDDAGSAIDLAWRVVGGPGGQLGAKQGEPYPVGDGTGQDFAGGKIFFSPDIGAHVVSGITLEKYEAAGGPTGELGFPTTNEADGDVPGSRVTNFGAPDAPAIVWTAEHGAIIVRGAMKAAWDELGGTGGDLGVPIADQSGEGTVTQNFSGGQVTYNSSNNSFSTQPPELADRLSGVQVPQGSTPTTAPPAPQGNDDAGASDGSESAWKSWYLWVIIPVVALALASLGAFLVLRQRRAAARDRFVDDDFHGGNAGEVPPAGGRDDLGEDYGDTPYHGRDERDAWASAGAGQGSGPIRVGDPESDDTDYLATQPPWAKRETGPKPWSDPVVPTGGVAATSAGPDLFTHHGVPDVEDPSPEADDEPVDPDSVDTAPTRVVQPEADESSGRHAVVTSDESRPPWLTEGESYLPGPNSLFAPVYGAAPPPPPVGSDVTDVESRDDEQPDAEVSGRGHGIFGEPVGYGSSGGSYGYRGRSDFGSQPTIGSRTEERDELGYGYQDYRESTNSLESSDPVEVTRDQPGDADRPVDLNENEPEVESAIGRPDVAPPSIHLPLEDPDEAPAGYPVKGSMRTGTYHSPGSASYDVTVAEIWFASEQLAESNGFTRAE